jgi:hypothetical protein
MTGYGTLLREAFLEPSAAPSQRMRSGYTLAEDYCAGIPPVFDKDEVKAVVREMLCHIQRVLELAGDLACQSEPDEPAPDAPAPEEPAVTASPAAATVPRTRHRPSRSETHG